MRKIRVAMTLGLLALSAASTGWGEALDAYMGDWQGDNAGTPLVAQVMALGDGKYQANLLPAFDQRVDAVAVMEGTESAGKVTFSGQGAEGVIEGAGFTGKTAKGAFALKKVERLSPTLGEKPPQGAVVLFDGSNTNAWEHQDQKPWAVDLKKATGGTDNCVAYLQTSVFSPKAQRVRIELGSDDAVKLWVNYELVHGNNTSRGVQPGNDKVFVLLKEGWNVILAKVIQGSGDWGFCAKVCPLLGDQIPGFKLSANQKDDDALTGPAAHDFIMAWNVAGPFSKPGLDAAKLFDEAFPPENPAASNYELKALPPPGPVDKTCRWKLVEGGAMQVFGGGSLLTKQTFKSQKLHIEFKTPFMPKMRGQARGNSGVYVQGRYEVQVLDSYGLEGVDNECGGIYKVAKPLVNMCAPPGQWQTYDITFTAPEVDGSGKTVKNARITVVHNGVVIHDNLDLTTTPGGCCYDLSQPGPLMLQDHGNPVEYRNIWVQELP